MRLLYLDLTLSILCFRIDKDLNTQVGPFTTAQYIIIHGVIIFLCILLTHVRVLPLTTLCVRASQRLHDLMFSTMIKGIMRFFDTSSSGNLYIGFRTYEQGLLFFVSCWKRILRVCLKRNILFPIRTKNVNKLKLALIYPSFCSSYEIV